MNKLIGFLSRICGLWGVHQPRNSRVDSKLNAVTAEPDIDLGSLIGGQMSNTMTVTVGSLVLLWLTTSAYGAVGTGKGATTASTSTQSSNQSQGQTATNAPFESVMLAYGALDQAMKTLAERTCSYVKPRSGGEAAPLIVIIDQASLANAQAYDAFTGTARLLEISFNRLGFVMPTKLEKSDLDKLLASTAMTFAPADITSAIATIMVASNTESASTITIQDVSAALKLSAYLTHDKGCKTNSVEVAYPAISVSDTKPLEDTFTNLAKSREDALERVVKKIDSGTPATSATPATPGTPATPATNQWSNAFNSLDGSYNLFLQSSFGVNGTTGQIGLASVVQGYGLRNILQSQNRQVYAVYVNVAAAGGTQHVTKNVVTAIFTGDLISYSGGVVVNTMIIKNASPLEVLNADVLRYRTPLTGIENPIHWGSTREGDNLYEKVASPPATK
jgi:hypothetical protein